MTTASPFAIKKSPLAKMYVAKTSIAKVSFTKTFGYHV